MLTEREREGERSQQISFGSIMMSFLIKNFFLLLFIFNFAMKTRSEKGSAVSDFKLFLSFDNRSMTLCAM
jgi:hypothetical protein